jgi:hypothetical protein
MTRQILTIGKKCINVKYADNNKLYYKTNKQIKKTSS